MSTQTQKARVVFVAAIEAGASADTVIATAAALAQGIAGGELHLVHVIDDPMPKAADLGSLSAPAERLDTARATLDRAVANTRKVFSGHLVGHLAVGMPWREIVQTASNLFADVIVVGTHGRQGIDRLLSGSVAELVVRKAKCPVVIARPKDWRAKDEPEIEPPCPDCVKVQHESHGDKLWCARHEKRHPHGHVHYEVPQPFAMGSMLVRPE